MLLQHPHCAGESISGHRGGVGGFSCAMRACCVLLCIRVEHRSQTEQTQSNNRDNAAAATAPSEFKSHGCRYRKKCSRMGSTCGFFEREVGRSSAASSRTADGPTAEPSIAPHSQKDCPSPSPLPSGTWKHAPPGTILCAWIVRLVYLAVASVCAYPVPRYDTSSADLIPR